VASSVELALMQIDDWPAPDPRVALVSTTGVLATRGDLELTGPWASVTKLCTAMAVLMAAQDEELSLDDPAGPEGSTIRHLLAHASGLPFEGRAPIAPPEVRRIYSNEGFDLLGRILERTTGFTYEEYLRLQVLEPLGIGVEAIGRPAAGIAGNLAGVIRLAQELLAPSLLDRTLFREASTVAFPGLPGIIPGLGRYNPCDWGLGFEIRNGKEPHWTGENNSADTFGHFGGSGSFLWVDPQRSLAMCGLSDRTFDDDNWAIRHWPPLFDAVLAAVD
jgi:CubicO group peptidase (beta-lactamase class C family)